MQSRTSIVAQKVRCKKFKQPRAWLLFIIAIEHGVSQLNFRANKMAQNQPTTQPKNHNHVLIGVIVILALAAVIGITVLFGNRYYDANVEGRQQDTDEMSRLLAAITEYQTNNNGKFPSDAAKLKSDYIRGSFPYAISFTNLDEGETEKLPSASNTMYVIKNATCDDGGRQAIYNSLSRRFVIMYHPEGLTSAICIE